MKYLYQAGIIFLFTFLGETLAKIIPFPIPAVLWGLLLLFLALCVKLRQRRRSGLQVRSASFIQRAVSVAGQGRRYR